MSSPKTPPNPDHARLIEMWCVGFEQTFRVPYVFQGGKDGVAVKRLLAAGITPEKAMETAKIAWSKPPSKTFWNCNTQCARLHQFAAAFSAITVEIEKNRVRVPNYQSF